MNIYPNVACGTYCTWLLANSNIRITPARKIQIQNVQTAANTGGTVTQLYFEEFVAYTAQWYLSYQQYQYQQSAANSPTSYDALTTAWLANVISPSQQTVYAIDAFFKQLRADGNLAIDYLFVFAQDQQANARISIFNSGTYNITEVGTPTWTAYKGYTGNGSSMYLKTNFINSAGGTNYTLNSGSAGVYVRQPTSSLGRKVMGAYDGTNDLEIGINNSTYGFYGLINDVTVLNAADTTSQGLYIANRTTSTIKQLWKNGVQSTSATTTATGLSTVATWIMCLNFGGTPSGLDNNQYAMAFQGAGSLNMVTFNSAVNLLMTNLGAHY